MVATGRWAGVVALGMTMVMPSPANAARKDKHEGPTQIVPAKKAEKAGGDDLSDNGQRRGITEISLGAFAGAAGVALLGRGIWEIGEGRRVKRECAAGTLIDTACTRANPGNGGFIAAGLSIGLMVPFAVASGLLIARGVKINRAYKVWNKQQGKVALSASPTHAGVSVSMRF